NGSDWKVGGRVGANQTSRFATDVTLGADWSFRVYAVNAAGRSDYSEVVTFARLAAPSDLTFGVYNEETRTLEMSWTDNSFNEDYFVVEYSKNGSDWKVGGRVGANQTSRFATDVTLGADWSFRVYAVNAAERSDYSNVAVFNSSAISDAFAELFEEEDGDDDFWFEFEKAVGAR
ncbi:MAG: fibronectin type III domain-containing protein, partial [Thermoguttaceae bacterium]|nr:fibronectin type III domain-containing protein [Thermoguttaceae bacterium]